MKPSFSRFLVPILIAASFILPASNAQAAPTITASLKVEGDSSVQVPCPYTFKFTGTIQVSQVGVIQYRFVRSDGGLGPLTNLSCTHAGSYGVTYTWTLSGPYNAWYQGWVALRVVYPVAVESNKAQIGLECHLKTPEINPDFLNTYIYGGPPKTPRLYVRGWNFGAAQGTRNVTLDGVPALPRPGWQLVSWSDGSIAIDVRICDLILWDHVYQMAITENGKVISNTIPFRPLYYLATPNDQIYYHAGDTLILNVYNLPASPAGYAVKFYGGNVLPIQSWVGATGCTPGQIKATIPKLTPQKQYVIGLFKNGQICSDDRFFIEVQLPKFPIPIK